MPTAHPTRGVGLLPIELLQNIFELHTLANLDSPYVLRQVCRHWRKIVDITTILRTRIYFGDGTFRREEMVRCRSLTSLLQAIQRTQNYQHELTIAAPAESMDDPTCLEERRAEWINFVSSGTSLCRRLTIHATNKSLSCQFSLENCNFPELCELQIGTANSRIIKYTRFLDAVQRSSGELRDLTVNNWDMTPELPKYPQLLRRLTRLTMNADSRLIPPTLWEHLINLVDLTVSNEDLLHNHVKGTSPSLSRLTVGVLPKQALLPLAIYGQVTTLIIRLDTNTLGTISQTTGKKSSVRMPSLQYLEIHSIWLLICTIQAPTLSMLVLRGARPTRGPFLKLGDHILCRPKGLHIDMGKSIIDVHLARRLGECWANIEQLHLTYVTPDSSPSFTLRTVLEGDALHVPACPRLRILEVVMPPPILNAEIRRKNTLQELKRMAQIRRSKNMLERGHCGWFTAFPLSHQKIIEDASRNWWNIEWFNLLE
jgi:hypothetical protein